MTHARVRTRVEHLFDLDENCGHRRASDLEDDDYADHEAIVMEDEEYDRTHGLDNWGDVGLCYLSPEGRRLVTERYSPEDALLNWPWSEIGERYLSQPGADVSRDSGTQA